jgi:hypothetical protein
MTLTLKAKLKRATTRLGTAKHLMFATLMALSIFSTHSLAASSAKGLGVGVILGEPSGLSAKYFLTDREAIDAALSYSFQESFIVESSYLFHFPSKLSLKRGNTLAFNPYVGAGLALGVSVADAPNDGFVIGFRVPLGIEFVASLEVPIKVFVEIAPGLSLAPSTEAWFQGGIGARYYF